MKPTSTKVVLTTQAGVTYQLASIDPWIPSGGAESMECLQRHTNYVCRIRFKLSRKGSKALRHAMRNTTPMKLRRIKP